MKKGIATLVLAGLLLVSVNAFAFKGDGDFAIGAELTSTSFVDVGGMLTLHIPGLPLFLGLGANFVPELQLATTADYWLHHAQLLEMFLEITPAWLPVTGSDFDGGNFQAQLAVGFRIWP